MLLDYRCPKCNQPIKGNEEVAIVKALPLRPPTSCPHCKANVKLNPAPEHIGGTPLYSFE